MKPVPPKPKPAAKPKAKPSKPKPSGGGSAGKFKWPGDKKNVHSISYGQHKTNVKTKKEVGTLDFTAPVDPAHALTEVNASTRMRYGQQESDLNDMVRQSGVQQGNITNWFDQYKADLDKTKTAQASYIQGQVDANKQVAAQAGGQTQFAPGTDASVVAAEQQGAAQRESQIKTLGAAMSAAGTAENNYLANRKNVGSAAQLTSRLDESRNLTKVRGEQNRLKAEEGDFKTTELGKIRDRERQYGLEASALNVKTDTAAATAKHQKTQDKNVAKRTKIAETSAETSKRNADRTYQLNVKKNGQAAAKDAYQRTHKTGPYKPAASKAGAKGGGKPQTGAQRQAFQDSIGSARTYAADMHKQKLSRHEAAALLLRGQSSLAPTQGSSTTPGRAERKARPAFKELEASIALDLAYDGAVSRKNVAKAHKVGLAIGDLPTQTARRAKVKKAAGKAGWGP